MATLVSELVRCLSKASAREIRARLDGPAFSRSELNALATLQDMSEAVISIGPAPDDLMQATDLESLEALAAFDMTIVDRARKRDD